MLLVEQRRSRPVTAESQLVVALEKLDLAGPAFDSVFDGSQTELVEHMHDEEVWRSPFYATAKETCTGGSWATGTLAHLGSTNAPSYSSTEHRSGTVVVEPIAALIDRVRDAVHRAT
jgi:hypothetical protein